MERGDGQAETAALASGGRLATMNRDESIIRVAESRRVNHSDSIGSAQTGRTARMNRSAETRGKWSVSPYPAENGALPFRPWMVFARILAIIAGVELVESFAASVFNHPTGVGEILIDAAVIAVIGAPFMYFWVARDVTRRLTAHASLARTALEQDLALKAYEDQLALREYAETVVASVPSGLATLSTDLRVVSVNRAFRDMFSLAETEMRGQPLEKVLPGVSPWRLVAEVLGSDQPAPTISVDVPDPNGARHFHLTLTRLRRAEGGARLLLVVEDITRRVRMQEQIEAERARFWGILDAASDAIVSVDEAQRIIVFNKQAERIFGYAADETIGRPLGFLLPPRFQRTHDEHVARFSADTTPWKNMSERPVLLGRRKNGEEFPVEVTISKLRLDGQWVLTAIVRDVTERRRAEGELRESREALQDFLDSASDLVQSVTPDGRFAYVNRAWLQTMGYARDEVERLTCLDVIHPDHRDRCGEAVRRAIGGEPVTRIEAVFVKKDGSLITVEGSLDARSRDGVAVTRAIFRDITQRKLAEERLNALAHYDTLTGLPNRLLFQDRLAQALNQARRERRLVGLLYLDLDRFKLINDTLGHTIGDQLLKTVAQRLVGCVRASNAVSRLGGDEFTIVLPGLTTPEGAAVVARKILRAVSQPVSIQGHEVFVTPSIGVTISPTDGDDIEILLKNADTAMYRAKERGNAYQFYAAEMHSRALDRLALESHLRRALEQEEFFLAYQPLVALGTGRVVGIEALARWRRPGGEVVAPGDFIPLAEETGLIVPIGEWALRAACAQNRAWQESGLPPVRVSVNLSSHQVARLDLPDVVERALRDSRLDPRYLDLELTESIFMRDAEATSASLRRLHAMGVALSIDDFGTGYSSLSYLKRFPIGTLKIGQGFMRDVTTNPDDAAIVTTIIAMAHSLNMRVVAEGIERVEQLDFLRARRCDVMQGELVSMPVPADAVPPFLRAGWRLAGRRAA